MRSHRKAALAIAVAFGAAAGLVGPTLTATASPQIGPETRICGQIKNGPHAKGQFPLDGRIVTGRTWTVFADGASCRFAMAKTPALLKQWAKTKPNADLKPGLAGWICKRAGTVNGECFKKGSSWELDFWMMGTYTLAQLKAFKLLGH